MSEPATLDRSLSLTQMVLYGLGTTVGAGIYALIGEIADVAGYFAPWAFLLAALLAGFTALSFAQLSARFPRAAGAALYVERGFDSTRLAQLVGLLVIFAGTVSAAALLNGFVGYLYAFIDLPRTLVIVGGGTLLILIAVWGIAQSVWIAGAISVVEVLGLLWITALASQAVEPAQIDPAVFIPDLSATAWAGIATGGVLSFYAYIGFEDMVEVAEEVKDVTKTLPRAILITLGLSTLIYVLLVTSAVMATGPELLANSTAPLADVYRHLTGSEPWIISFIGLFAIINGALIQVIMASRVIYGLASRQQLPRAFGSVNRVTHTPIPATFIAGATVLGLALAGNLAILAELTAVIMLTVFALVNFALTRLTWRTERTRSLIAAVGGAVCLGFAARSTALWIAG